MSTEENTVTSRFLIYSDEHITWNNDINDWNHSAEFTGTYLDANEYARSLFGKKYTLNTCSSIQVILDN
jgi:hypothetical protein